MIAIDPTDPTAYVELMTIYGQAGLWQQAEKVLDAMGPTTAKQYQSLTRASGLTGLYPSVEKNAASQYIESRWLTPPHFPGARGSGPVIG